jgi:hypothetical protein
MNIEGVLADPVGSVAPPPAPAKVSACEACYQKKVKCDRGPSLDNNTTPPCSRCEKKNIKCESRTRRRGRPLKPDGSKHKSRKSKSTSGRDNKSRSTSAVPRERKKSTATPTTPVRFPASRRVAGWRSCEAFLAQADSEAQYKAVANLLGTMKEMGSVANPEWLQWVCRGMVCMALHDKSMGLLHAATTLAVSAGFPIDATYMEVPNEKVRDYRSLITSRMFSILSVLPSSPMSDVPFRGQPFDPSTDSVGDGPRNCGYILQMDYGRRVIKPDALYQHLFGTQQELDAKMAESPGMTKFWYPIVNHIGDLKPFAKMWVQKVLKELAPTPDGVLHFDVTQKEVQVHDRRNHVWVGDLVEATCIGDMGRRLWYVFGLLNMRRVRGERYDPEASALARAQRSFVVTKNSAKIAAKSSRKRGLPSTTANKNSSKSGASSGGGASRSISASGRSSPVSPNGGSQSSSGEHSPGSSASSVSTTDARPAKQHRKVKHQEADDTLDEGQLSFLTLREFDFENDDLAADIFQWPSELEAPESQTLNSTFSLLLDDYVVPRNR